MTTQGTEARSAETTGSARKGDGPVPAGDAPEHPTTTDWQNRAERAEAECKELRERLDETIPYTAEEIEIFQKCFDRDVLPIEALMDGTKAEKLTRARNALNGS